MRETVKSFDRRTFMKGGIVAAAAAATGSLLVSCSPQATEGVASAEDNADNMQPGSTDLCFELDGNIDDLRMLRDYFEKQGLDVSDSLVPRNGLRGAMQSFYLRDPDGNSIEISSYGR